MLMKEKKLPEYTTSLVPCPNIIFHALAPELVTHSDYVTQ